MSRSILTKIEGSEGELWKVHLQETTICSSEGSTTKRETDIVVQYTAEMLINKHLYLML